MMNTGVWVKYNMLSNANGLRLWPKSTLLPTNPLKKGIALISFCFGKQTLQEMYESHVRINLGFAENLDWSEIL